MAESFSVSGPVHVEGDSKYRAALELMRTIASVEKSKTKDRAYFLLLYYECLRVANSHPPTISKDE